MEFISEQKFLLLSPRKVRPVVDVIRKMSPTYALAVLPQVNKKAADSISKVIKSAIANAKVKGVSESDLSFKEIQINEGPRLKRGRPVSRGMWHPVKKRMSHIRIVLQTVDRPQATAKMVSKDPAKSDKKKVNNDKTVELKKTKTKKGAKQV